MGVQVVALVALDVVFPLVRDDDGRLCEEVFPIGCLQHLRALCLTAVDLPLREVAAVVHEADIIRLEVLPRPVDGRELAVVRVLRADVVAGVVARVAEVEVRGQRPPHMDGQVGRVPRHPVRLVRGDHNSNGMVRFFHDNPLSFCIVRYLIITYNTGTWGIFPPNYTERIRMWTGNRGLIVSRSKCSKKSSCHHRDPPPLTGALSGRGRRLCCAIGTVSRLLRFC